MLSSQILIALCKECDAESFKLLVRNRKGSLANFMSHYIYGYHLECGTPVEDAVYFLVDVKLDTDAPSLHFKHKKGKAELSMYGYLIEDVPSFFADL